MGEGCPVDPGLPLSPITRRSVRDVWLVSTARCAAGDAMCYVGSARLAKATNELHPLARQRWPQP
eukprot:6195682-Pleurochrysis_carterae.AAC.1